MLFLDSWRIPNYGLLRDKATILELALGLVVFTVIGVGFLIHWMIPAMPLPVAFALAAIVSPTDDASGLVCFRFAVAATMTGTFSLASASHTLLWVSLVGAGIGVAVTLGVSALQMALSGRFGEETGTPILVNLLLPFGAYLLAEQFSASGILAGVRGAITLAGVMTLPLLLLDGTHFPARELAIFLATAVILVSMVVASIGLPRALKGLELPEEQSEWLAARVIARKLVREVDLVEARYR